MTPKMLSSLVIKVFFLSLLLTLFSPEAWTRYRPTYAAFAIDAASGKVLYYNNADTFTHPASLTKMMTLYLLFDALDRRQVTKKTRIRISRRATRQKPSKLGLGVKQTISVQDAIMALITKSANDVAVAVAEALGGTEPNFARLMTKKARSLGMPHTTFKNASGLHRRHQLTTARDMATLSRKLFLKHPKYFHLFKTRTFHYKGRKYGNHNKLLGKVPGVDGIKTGYVYASGFNLAVSVVRGGKRIIVIVMGGRTRKGRDKEMIRLINATFKKHQWLVPFPRKKPTATLRLAQEEDFDAEERHEDSPFPRKLPSFKFALLEHENDRMQPVTIFPPPLPMVKLAQLGHHAPSSPQEGQN